jgi:hypothetical protein
MIFEWRPASGGVGVADVRRWLHVIEAGPALAAHFVDHNARSIIRIDQSLVYGKG